jgi:hypothetical protein
VNELGRVPPVVTLTFPTPPTITHPAVSPANTAVDEVPLEVHAIHTYCGTTFTVGLPV